jgi:hypothetical protein
MQWYIRYKQHTCSGWGCVSARGCRCSWDSVIVFKVNKGVESRALGVVQVHVRVIRYIGN